MPESKRSFSIDVLQFAINWKKIITLLLLLLPQFPVAYYGVGRNHVGACTKVQRSGQSCSEKMLSGGKLRITIQLAPLTLEVVFAFQSVLIK